jgi:hypothetical protein
MQPFLNALKCFIEFEKEPRKKASRYDMQLLKREANPGKTWKAYLDNYIVIDVDHKNGKAIGIQEFDRLTKGDFFSTFTVKTKTGGYHYWFKRPDARKYKSFTPIPGYKDIELKADVSTGSNQITHPLSPGYSIHEDVEPSECPEWLLAILVELVEPKTTEAKGEGDPIGQGGRHEALKKYASSLRYSGSNEAEILAALRIRNEIRCVPPVDDSELIQLAKDFSKKGVAPDRPMREDEPPDECYDGYAPHEEEDIPPFDFDEEIKKEKAPRFYLTKLCNLKLIPMSYLVRDLVPVESTGQFYGDTGTWKTFYGIDMACCVATGREFHGKKTKQAPVIYIAGEGKQQIVKRFGAWSIVNSIELPDIEVYISSGPVEMISKDSVDDLIISIKNTIADSSMDIPGMIILDTFARNFGPGDENKTADMNLYINAIDRVKEHFQCTTISIHHTGLISKERARGSYANKCALDFEYYFEKDDEVELLRVTCTKMKDADFPKPMAFTAHSVGLNMKDEEGKDVTSLIIRATEWIEKEQKGKEDKGRNQQIMISILNEWFANPEHKSLDVEEWKRLSIGKSVSRSSFYANKEKWVNDGMIRIEFNQVYLGGKI